MPVLLCQHRSLNEYCDRGTAVILITHHAHISLSLRELLVDEVVGGAVGHAVFDFASDALALGHALLRCHSVCHPVWHDEVCVGCWVDEGDE